MIIKHRQKTARRDVYNMGKRMGRRQYKTKAGHVLTAAEIFGILINEFRKHDDRHDDIDDVFMQLMNFETGYQYFRAGFFKQMSKNKWQRKRGGRQNNAQNG